ncbi:MAG: DHHA1 domain-containing protein [Lachnospiraceae bacterium]|nr:DHHA1 domain-containing protein [Lachnospiraceae bacterium]
MKFYESQSYKKVCQTTVTFCKKEGDKITLKLADSIFFPEGGGQHADTGWLIVDDKKIRLLDGQLAEGQPVYQVEEELPVGTKVKCVLDWEQRYMRMQQHSGEHIIMGVIHNKYGLENMGFHLSDTQPVTLVLNGSLTKEQIREIEIMANEIVYANLPVIATFPTNEELKTNSYRSKMEITGQVRIITIGNEEQKVDVCACCAPHVARTGEVGLVKVVSVENYKGGVRIGILCGKRAFLHYDEQQSLMNEISHQLSTPSNQVSKIIQNQRKEIFELRNKLGELVEKDLFIQIKNLNMQEHVCIFTEESLSIGIIKNVYNTMTKKFLGYVGVFMGNDEDGYRYCAGSKNLDSRELIKKMREVFATQGGGNKEMVQGKVKACKSEIQKFFEEIE